jgi:hypothetical protein
LLGLAVCCFMVSMSFYLCCSTFMAADFALSGNVVSTCLARISASVSIMSSVSSCCLSDHSQSAFSTCTVGAARAGGGFVPSTCICWSRRAHLVAPSTSSRFRSLFLNASRDRNYWYTDGVRSFSDGSPVILFLCFAPIAAWSYFSTDYTFSVSFFSSPAGAMVWACPFVGWVEVSLS